MAPSDNDTQPCASNDDYAELVVEEVLPGDPGPWIIETESGTQYLLNLADEQMRVASDDGVEDYDIGAVINLPKVGSAFSVEVFEADGSELILLKSLPVRHIVRFPDDLFPGEPDWVEIVENVCESEPRNAWLLVGDGASMPSAEDVAAQWTSGEEGLPEWTCPKHIQPGDLVFLYFMAPEKAVHFVARALTYAEFDPTRGVNSIKEVDTNQWWTILSPFVPVGPIAFKQMEDHFGHKLILRGKPTHYVPPRAFDRIVEGLGELDDDQALILQRPIGNDELPPAGQIGLAELKEMAAGALDTESMVEEYIVEPLLSLVFPTNDGFRITRQHRLASGRIPDFAVFNGDELLGLIEAKLGIGRGSGSLVGCPEVAQISRYCQEAGLPGLLIDANEIVLISSDQDEPVAYFERATLVDDDLAAIAGFLTADS